MGRRRAALLQRGIDATTDAAVAVDDGAGDLSGGTNQFPPLDGTLPLKEGRTLAAATVSRSVPVRSLASTHLNRRIAFQNEKFCHDSLHVVDEALAIVAEIEPVHAAEGLPDDADSHTIIISNIVAIGLILLIISRTEVAGKRRARYARASVHARLMKFNPVGAGGLKYAGDRRGRGSHRCDERRGGSRCAPSRQP